MKVAVVLLCSLLPLFFYEFVQGMSRPIDNVYGTCSEDDGAFSEDDGDGDYVPGEEVRSNDSLLYLLVSPRPTRPRPLPFPRPHPRPRPCQSHATPALAPTHT
jgi:hypothetical protein